MRDPVKILLVEDEVVTSIYLKMRLEKMGCSVIKTLTRGEDAVEAAVLIDAHLILMDINLAGALDGIEAARMIKEKFDLPVIFITGYSDNSIIENALSLDPLGFLLKPLDYGKLQSIINDFLN